MFVSVSVESVPYFSMVTALSLTSLAKIEHGGYKILRGCGKGNGRDRMKIQFNKGNFLMLKALDNVRQGMSEI